MLKHTTQIFCLSGRSCSVAFLGNMAIPSRLASVSAQAITVLTDSLGLGGLCFLLSGDILTSLNFSEKKLCCPAFSQPGFHLDLCADLLPFLCLFCLISWHFWILRMAITVGVFGPSSFLVGRRVLWLSSRRAPPAPRPPGVSAPVLALLLSW